MTDIQLAKDVMDIWDKEWPSEEEGLERACLHGDMIYGGGNNFDEVWNELHQKDEPDMEMVFDYIFNAFYYEVLKFCGCGCPPAIMTFLLDVLECFVNDGIATDFFGSKGEQIFNDKFHDPDPVFMEFMVKYLDSLGLCEHGTSWHGSWLTSKGKTYRELLRRCKEREFEAI